MGIIFGLSTSVQTCEYPTIRIREMRAPANQHFVQGYSYDAVGYYNRLENGNTNDIYGNHNRGWVPIPFVHEIGFEDCDVCVKEDVSITQGAYDFQSSLLCCQHMDKGHLYW